MMCRTLWRQSGDKGTQLRDQRNYDLIYYYYYRKHSELHSFPHEAQEAQIVPFSLR